jgi:hypothetical protein
LLVQPLALHDEVGYQTERHVRLLDLGLGAGGCGAAAPVACLTGFEAKLAFDCPDDFFDVPLLTPL